MGKISMASRTEKGFAFSVRPRRKEGMTAGESNLFGRSKNSSPPTTPFTMASFLHRGSLLSRSSSRGLAFLRRNYHQGLLSQNTFPVGTESLLDQRRSFSSSPAPVAPFLIGWKGQGKTNTTETWRPSLLFPFQVDPKQTIVTVDSIEEAVNKINEHYSNDNRFVGGMGESDPGVGLLSLSDDIIDNQHTIINLIKKVKEERHGVPFHLYTTGLCCQGFLEDKDWKKWKKAKVVDTWQVSLYAGAPHDYEKGTGLQTMDDPHPIYGQVCGFVAEATEHGMAVETTILKEYATTGRDMANALGSRQTHIAQL